MSSSKRIIAYILLAVGVGFIGLGVFYFTTDTSFLASDYGRHPTHAAGSTGFGIALIAAGIIMLARSRKSAPQRKD